MQKFFEMIIKPHILESKYRNICEIGAEKGGNTDKIASINFVDISVIDPCLDENLCAKYQNNKQIKVLKGLSLEILYKVSERFDCILIDGDHNWYTVFNELKTIHEKDLLEKGGTIFLHDVCWPYGRRDMYYIPDSIPEEFRHPYEKKGIKRGIQGLSSESEFNHNLNNAIYEGGEKNGVLTAIEDFIRIYGKKYLFFVINKEFGLGILIKNKNIITKIKYLKWLLKVKYDESFPKVVNFFTIKLPLAYKICARIVKILNIK